MKAEEFIIKYLATRIYPAENIYQSLNQLKNEIIITVIRNEKEIKEARVIIDKLNEIIENLTLKEILTLKED